MGQFFNQFKFHTNNHVGLISLMTLLILIGGVAFTLNLASKDQQIGSFASAKRCIPLPRECLHGEVDCPRLPKGIAWCQPSTPSCGSVVVTDNMPTLNQDTVKVASCAWNALQNCLAHKKTSDTYATAVLVNNGKTNLETFTLRSIGGGCFIQVEKNKSKNSQISPTPSVPISISPTPNTSCVEKTVCPPYPSGYKGAPHGCYVVKVCPTVSPIPTVSVSETPSITVTPSISITQSVSPTH